MASFEDVVSNTQNVFYIGTDQRVHQFYAVPGYSWASYDINAATGAVAAATDSPLSCWSTQGAVVKITGNVIAGGMGFSGVTLSLTGTSASGVNWSRSTLTEGNGSYRFLVPFGGNYTVTPSAGDYTFDPPSANFSNLNAAQTANFTGYINGASTNPSTPDPGPAPYPNYLSSVPPPGPGAPDCSDLSGTWTDTDSRIWTLTQNGSTVGGTSLAGSVTWQVTGSGSGAQYVLNASNPSPSMVGNVYEFSAIVALTLTGCNAGAATTTLVAPPDFTFVSTGSNTAPGPNTAWARPSAPTYTLSSPAQMTIPGATNNAQMVAMSTGDTLQVTTTASSSNHPVQVSYTSSLAGDSSTGNPHSTCVASLSVGQASGTGSATSNMTASPSGCSGIFYVTGFVGGTTTNPLTAVVPPQIMIQTEVGEAGAQIQAGDDTMAAVLLTARNRFGDPNFPGGSQKTWQAVLVPSQFYGASNTTATGVQPELTNAALVFSGATDVNVLNCEAYWSPTNDQYTALQSWARANKPASAISDASWTNVVGAPYLWVGKPKQAVIKGSIRNNVRAGYSSAPAIVLFREAPIPTAPAVIEIQ